MLTLFDVKTGRILIPLPNTGAMGRKRNNFYMRSVFLLALCIFGLLQYHNFNYRKWIV